jgi:hypothetical protein
MKRTVGHATDMRGLAHVLYVPRVRRACRVVAELAPQMLRAQISPGNSILSLEIPSTGRRAAGGTKAVIGALLGQDATKAAAGLLTNQYRPGAYELIARSRGPSLTVAVI